MRDDLRQSLRLSNDRPSLQHSRLKSASNSGPITGETTETQPACSSSAITGWPATARQSVYIIQAQIQSVGIPRRSPACAISPGAPAA